MSDVDTDAPADDAVTEDADPDAGDAPRSRRRPGPVIALGLAAALVIGALTVALIGGDDFSPVALTVDGTRTTSATLDNELEGFARSEFFAAQAEQGQTPFVLSAGNGSLNAQGTSNWLVYRTQGQFAETILARRGTPLSDQQVEAAGRQLEKEGVIEGMSRSAAETFTRFVAATNALGTELGSYDAYRSAMQREAKRANITVDPKYARWSERFLAFCVPAGCRSGGAVAVPSEQTSSSGG